MEEYDEDAAILADDQHEAASKAAYDAYMRDLDQVSRLSNDEQSILQRWCQTGGARSCLLLARQVPLIVAYVVAKMRQQGSIPSVVADDLDAIQEGNIAGLRALQKWDPTQGTLGSWLFPHIRGAILNYANSHLQIVGSKHTSTIRAGMDEAVAYDEIPASQDEPGSEQLEAFSLEESLVYDRPVLPEPESAAEHAALVGAINRLETLNREAIVLNLWGLSVQEIADAQGVSNETARRRLHAALMAVRVDLGEKWLSS